MPKRKEAKHSPLQRLVCLFQVKCCRGSTWVAASKRSSGCLRYDEKDDDLLRDMDAAVLEQGAFQTVKIGQGFEVVDYGAYFIQSAG